jgi:transcriptional regulator with XRE-family HTH domain
MTIGERIRKRRLEIGLTAEAVADALNKNRATIYRYESNEIEKLPIIVLEPLAKILKTTPAYLMGWVEESPTKKEDAIVDILSRLRTDEEFLEVVEILNKLTTEQLISIKQMLSAFEQH